MEGEEVISEPFEVSAERASWELLRAIARTPNCVDTDQIRSLAQIVGNSDAVIELAEQHRVAPMLFTRIKELSGIPHLVRLQASYERDALRAFANAAELIRLLDAFDREKIAAMPFKGVVLGASVYHDLTTRPAGDLDILIYDADRRRAAAILLQGGYELLTPVQGNGSPVAPNCYEYRFERQSDGTIVELRWRLSLSWPKFKRDLGMDWIWPQRQSVKLAGAEIPNMSPETMLLVLCMHGTKHMWTRLIWICDVAWLLDRTPSLDWAEVARQARKTGLQRSLATGVLLANRIGGCSVPVRVLEHFESNASARTIAGHLEENLFRAPGSKPAGRLTYGLHVLDTRDRIKVLLSLDMLRPNERDKAMVALPRSLHALYFLLRPVRIFLDRSAR